MSPLLHGCYPTICSAGEVRSPFMVQDVDQQICICGYARMEVSVVGRTPSA